jgi:DME family drug/metabolite transporter
LGERIAERSRLGAFLVGYLLIAGAAFCWAASATVGRAVFTGQLFAGATAISPLLVAQTRTTFSVLVLMVLLVLSGQSDRFKMPRGELWRCLAIGVVGLAGANFFYYYAIQRTSVATAIIIQYTAPAWVLAYTAMFRKQPAGPLRILAVALAIGGSMLAIGVGNRAITLDTLGVMAALGAAFSFSFYNLAGQRVLGRNSQWSVLLYALLGSAVFWAVVNPPSKAMAAHYSPAQWGFLLVFALASMLIPFSLYLGGLRRLDPTRAIVTSCLEPVFAIGFAAVFLRESLGWLQLFGVAVVLTATVAIQVPQRGLRSSPQSG